jgi:hypothetical protein
MGNRTNNERKFPEWENLPDGGRRYMLRVMGRKGWYAVYEKIVDARENTLSFRQLIYNNVGELMEVHKKFPVDMGHQIPEDKG